MSLLFGFTIHGLVGLRASKPARVGIEIGVRISESQWIEL